MKKKPAHTSSVRLLQTLGLRCSPLRCVLAKKGNKMTVSRVDGKQRRKKWRRSGIDPGGNRLAARLPLDLAATCLDVVSEPCARSRALNILWKYDWLWLCRLTGTNLELVKYYDHVIKHCLILATMYVHLKKKNSHQWLWRWWCDCGLSKKNSLVSNFDWNTCS